LAPPRARAATDSEMLAYSELASDAVVPVSVAPG